MAGSTVLAGVVRKCQMKRKGRRCNVQMTYQGTRNIPGAPTMFLEDWYCPKCDSTHTLFTMWEYSVKAGQIQ